LVNIRRQFYCELKTAWKASEMAFTDEDKASIKIYVRVFWE